jgi:hypothetical protein
MNWIKASSHIPKSSDTYIKRYVVITDYGADFGWHFGDNVWQDDEGERIKVYYWMEMPGDI